MNTGEILGVVFVATSAIIIAIALVFSPTSQKKDGWKKIKIGELFKVSVFYGSDAHKGQPFVYYVLKDYLREFLVATYKLHVVPGVNPHNGGSTSKVEKISVEHLSKKGFIDGCDILGFSGEEGRNFVSESFSSNKNLHEFSRNFVSSVDRERLFAVATFSKDSNLSIEEMTVARVFVDEGEEVVTFMPKFVDGGFIALLPEDSVWEFGKFAQVGPYWWSTEDLQSHHGFDIPGAKMIEIRFPSE